MIITGAPFSLFYYGTLLKKKFPHIKLIADIRDPWTNNKSAYSYSTISKKRQDYEKKLESSVFNSYNKVITVNREITNYFWNLYPLAKDKFVTIPNGFDPLEVDIEMDESLKMDEAKVNFAFTGSFYDKAVYLFDNLLGAVEQLRKEGYEQKIHFYFFGSNCSGLNDRLKDTDLRKSFTFGNFNNIAKVNGLIKNADYTLLFLTDDIDYSLSTKFCEYMKMKKKVLVFSKSGLTGKYVEEKKIGFHIKPGNELSMLRKLIDNKSNKVFPADFDITEFSIKKLTDNVIKLLQ